jgi:hypothetical protein
VRLDHLLSKEHSPEHALLNSQQTMSGRARLDFICESAGAHGWNTDNQFASSDSVCRPRSEAGGAGSDASYIGILLGPERTRESMFFLARICRQLRLYLSVPLGMSEVDVYGVVCVLFENCTVDASIFVVSNEERTVDALAPGADEGRRRLR